MMKLLTMKVGTPLFCPVREYLGDCTVCGHPEFESSTTIYCNNKDQFPKDCPLEDVSD